jgi:hypothetical protein
MLTKSSRTIREIFGLVSSERHMRVGANNRSKVSNGSALHLRGRVDLRKPEGRRWRDLFNGFRAEFGREPTVVQETMLRSAADLAVAHERLSGEIAGGRPIDDESLNRVAGNLRRVLTQLGLTGSSESPSVPNLEELMR